MDVSEKLVELLSQVQSFGVNQGNHITHQEGKTNREIASYLIDHGVTVQEWISVKDKQPKKEGSYLVYSSKSKTVFTAHYRPQFDRWANRANGQFITHWMPLPQPPKGE